MLRRPPSTTPIRVLALASALTAGGLSIERVSAQVNAQPASDSAAPTAPKAVVGMGTKAPALMGKFIKGEPVTEWEPGKVYVMEFWATWCGPCKAAIPHLNELHAKYESKGVIIIGQSVWEQSPENAPKFVTEMGDKMAYRIAVDHRDGEPEGSRGVMARTWLGAAGISGIPSTWVVKDGKVIWIGHPRDLSGTLLESMLDGSYDAQLAKKQLDEKAALQERTRKANQDFWDAVNDKNPVAIESAIANLKEVFGDRPGAAETLRGMRIRADVVLGNYDKALAAATSGFDKAQTPREKFNVRMRAAHELLIPDPTDPKLLKEISAIVDSMEIPPDPELARAGYLKLKYRAWVAILSGDRDTAVKLQEEVVAAMPETPLKPVEVRALSLYREGKPPSLMPKHSRERKAPATRPASN